MKKIILTTILGLFCVAGVFAQNWTKADSTELTKATEMAFAVDLSDATIMGLTRDKFPAYYASQYNTTENNAELLLDRFCNEMEYCYFTKERPSLTSNDKAKFKVVYKISYITEKGGFGGTYYVTNGKAKTDATPFAVKDGKWNTFDTLLLENAQKLFDHRWDKAKKAAKGALDTVKEGINSLFDR